jgi:hypothetical protein
MNSNGTAQRTVTTGPDFGHRAASVADGGRVSLV